MCVLLEKFPEEVFFYKYGYLLITFLLFVTDRYMVVHAGNRKGFVDGASLIFKSKKNSSDYHSEMNAETFENG
jgi:hypothetical protein